MRNYILVLMLLLTFHQNLTAQEQSSATKKEQGIRFSELTFNQALQEAKGANKLLFIDCYTTWCGPCKMLSNVVFKDSLVADYFNRSFINLKMDMEKGEGSNLRQKYDVRGYPTLLFLDAEGKVVHRLLGASKAPELLEKVRFGVENGGIAALRQRYAGGDRDFAFVNQYIEALSESNLEAEAEKVTTETLEGNEEKMLQEEAYFSLFYSFVHHVKSTAFQYVVAHQKELTEKYPRRCKNLSERLLEDWIQCAYPFLQVEGKVCTVDEKGLDAYVVQMDKAGVKEAKFIGEGVRLTADGVNQQWASLVKRGEKLLASHTQLGGDHELIKWCKLLNEQCSDQKLREKAAQWCDSAYKNKVQKDEEVKKNLPPGAIPAISMIDFKSQFLQLAARLRSPK